MLPSIFETWQGGCTINRIVIGYTVMVLLEQYRLSEFHVRVCNLYLGCYRS